MRWETFILQGEYDEAAEFCRERLLSVNGERLRLRWVKDLAVSPRLSGRPGDALNLLASHYTAAIRYGDTLTAKFECGMGRTYELLGKTDKALGHYTASRFYHEQKGNLLLAAEVDNNVGRVLTAAGRPEDALEPLNRALDVALSLQDVRLEIDVRESIAEAQKAWADSLRQVYEKLSSPVGGAGVRFTPDEKR
jgi:tetratricopeptide (TPR) repeat protein